MKPTLTVGYRALINGAGSEITSSSYLHFAIDEEEVKPNIDRRRLSPKAHSLSHNVESIMSNIADPRFREVKERQGGAHIRSANLFRLDGRTIISQFTP